MTPSGFVTWQHEFARVLADRQVAAGVWPTHRAHERAQAVSAELLPQGLDTPGMLLLEGVLPDGTPIGWLWITLQHPHGTPDCAFLYDIGVDAEHRGRGLGRALLKAAEMTVVGAGIGALELNVFVQNTVAVALYDSAGYTATTQRMIKHLAS